MLKIRILCLALAVLAGILVIGFTATDYLAAVLVIFGAVLSWPVGMMLRLILRHNRIVKITRVFLLVLIWVVGGMLIISSLRSGPEAYPGSPDPPLMIG